MVTGTSTGIGAATVSRLAGLGLSAQNGLDTKADTAAQIMDTADARGIALAAHYRSRNRHGELKNSGMAAPRP